MHKLTREACWEFNKCVHFAKLVSESCPVFPGAAKSFFAFTLTVRRLVSVTVVKESSVAPPAG